MQYIHAYESNLISYIAQTRRVVKRCDSSLKQNEINQDEIVFHVEQVNFVKWK